MGAEDVVMANPVREAIGVGGAVKAALRAHGFRLTGPRQRLVEELASRDTLVGTTELVIRGQALGLSRPTVFRLLELLLKLGLAARFLDEEGQRTSYALCTPDHHHHVVCTACRRVESVELPRLEAEVVSVAIRSGYELTRHAVELFGVCSSCREQG